VGSGRSWWSGSFVELRGVPSDAVETIEPQRKGMAVTWSFGTPVIDFSTLMGALSQYAMRAGEKLRQHGLNAARLTVFFHTNRHKPDRPQYGATRTITLHPMTSDSLELIHAARRGAEHAWRDVYGITKAGIMLDDLVAAELRPRTLFEGDTERRERVMGPWTRSMVRSASSPLCRRHRDSDASGRHAAK